MATTSVEFHLRSVGSRAVLVELADVTAVRMVHRHLRHRRRDGWLPNVTDIVPAARTILLDGNLGPVDRATLSTELTGLVLDVDAPPADSDVVEIPTVYDGPDLHEVARLWEVAADEVVAIHSGGDYTVVFCGFAPGFAYCTGLPAGREVARRWSPRPSVPAGSVALAGEFTGIYPRSSPGGWQLIGRTDLRLWDVEREPPALLTPGTRVRFRPVDA